ncbi:hypothetical protein V8E36_009146 [Tilletia maclaganii]
MSATATMLDPAVVGRSSPDSRRSFLAASGRHRPSGSRTTPRPSHHHYHRRPTAVQNSNPPPLSSPGPSPVTRRTAAGRRRQTALIPRASIFTTSQSCKQLHGLFRHFPRSQNRHARPRLCENRQSSRRHSPARKYWHTRGVALLPPGVVGPFRPDEGRGLELECPRWEGVSGSDVSNPAGPSPPPVATWKSEGDPTRDQRVPTPLVAPPLPPPAPPLPLADRPRPWCSLHRLSYPLPPR